MTVLDSPTDFNQYIDSLTPFFQFHDKKMYLLDLESVKLGKKKLNLGPTFLERNRYPEYRKYFAKTVNARCCTRNGESDFEDAYVLNCIKNGKFMIVTTGAHRLIYGFCIYRVFTAQEWHQQVTMNDARIAPSITNRDFILNNVVYIDLICTCSGIGRQILTQFNRIGVENGCNAIALNSTPRPYEFYVHMGFVRTIDLKLIYPVYERERQKQLVFDTEVYDGYYFMKSIT